MEKRTDKDGRDKNGSHDPAYSDIFYFLLNWGEKKKKWIDGKEVPVAQSSSSAGIIIRHKDDKNQNLGKNSHEDQPLIQFFSFGEKQEEKKNSRKKIPSYAGVPAEKVVKQIVGNELGWEEMLLRVPVRCHLHGFDGVEGNICLFQRKGFIKSFSLSTLIVPLAGDHVV